MAPRTNIAGLVVLTTVSALLLLGAHFALEHAIGETKSLGDRITQGLIEGNWVQPRK